MKTHHLDNEMNGVLDRVSEKRYHDYIISVTYIAVMCGIY